jgi:hypothetical protein
MGQINVSFGPIGQPRRPEPAISVAGPGAGAAWCAGPVPVRPAEMKGVADMTVDVFALPAFRPIPLTG